MSPVDSSPSVVIICVGNPLRGDDAVGPRIAAELEPAAGDQYELVIAHQLTPEMALPLSRARVAIVIDAAADLPPGAVRRRWVSPKRQPVPRSPLCHHHDLHSLIAMACSTFGRAAETWEVTVGGESWEVGQSLSPVVSAAIPSVLHNVDLIIACRLRSGRRACSRGPSGAALLRS